MNKVIFIVLAALYCCGVAADEMTYEDGSIVIDEAAQAFKLKMKADPYVVQVRKSFDSYVASTKQVNAKKDSIGYSKFSIDYFRSPFIAYYVQPEQFKGGQTVTIFPVNKSDKMLNVWVYPGSDDKGGIEYEVRSVSISPTKVDEKLLVLFKNILKDNSFWQ